MDNLKLPENVLSFMSRATSIYADLRSEDFNLWIWNECTKIKSPIEQLFLIGLSISSEVNNIPYSVVSSFGESGFDNCLQIAKQWRAGKYYVDFALRRNNSGKTVCVELDGHQFHDRDEKQRRYEKIRDRFLTAEGYRVLHFTGAEIARDPCAAAIECLRVVSDEDSIRDGLLHPIELFGDGAGK